MVILGASVVKAFEWVRIRITVRELWIRAGIGEKSYAIEFAGCAGSSSFPNWFPSWLGFTSRGLG